MFFNQRNLTMFICVIILSIYLTLPAPIVMIKKINKNEKVNCNTCMN